MEVLKISKKMSCLVSISDLVKANQIWSIKITFGILSDPKLNLNYIISNERKKHQILLLFYIRPMSVFHCQKIDFYEQLKWLMTSSNELIKLETMEKKNVSHISRNNNNNDWKKKCWSNGFSIKYNLQGVTSNR